MGALRAKVLGKTVAIAGLRSVRVSDPGALLERLRRRGELKGVVFQLLDAGLVAGPEHLLISAINAMRAFELSLNVSSDLGLEILTFASAQRQISNAIKLMGLKPGKLDVAAVVVADSEETAEEALEVLAEELGALRDDSVLKLDEQKAERIAETFKLSENEILTCLRLGGRPEAVRDLVLERVALSIVYR